MIINRLVFNHQLNSVDRILNFTFIFILIVLFILEGNSGDHIRIAAAVVICGLFAVIAFFLKWITLDAVTSAVVFGTVVLGLGGWVMAGLVLLFFLSGTYLSRDREWADLPDHTGFFSGRFKFRRNGLQVWANGFWMAFFIVGWFLLDMEMFFIAAVATLSTATADTWATEIGSRDHVNTVLITNFRKVEPGTEGGVSWNGILAAISGAVLIGLVYLLLTGTLQMRDFGIIAFCGSLGCIVDSFLGAVYQYGNDDSLHWFNRYFKTPEAANSAVNWAASGFGGWIALLFFQWI